MNPVLEQIERELMAAVGRRTARRAARRRALITAAVVSGLLLLASVASAVTGVGPVGGLFREDGSVSTGPQPVPGTPRVLMHAGGEGAEGWDLFFYRGKPQRHLPGRVSWYCLSLTRSDAKPIPRGGIPGRPSPDDLYGASATCEYPRILAARVWQRGIDLNSGGGAPGEAVPYWGLVLADTQRVALSRDGERVDAELSPSVELEVPRLPLALRRQFESREQMRETAGVPRVVQVRAFIGIFDAVDTPVGARTPVVLATATMADGTTRTDRVGGRRAMPQFPPGGGLETEPAAGKPSVRLAGTGRDGREWRAVAFRTSDGGLCFGAAPAPQPAHRGSLSCGAPAGHVARGLRRRGINSDLATGLPDGRRPDGSFAHVGIVHPTVRSVVFPRRRGTPIVADLSRRVMGVRLFLAVMPPGTRDPLPVLHWSDGRRTRPYYR